jgi:tRNA threonylcarbamoyladenosine biosynthesis protein TsaB
LAHILNIETATTNCSVSLSFDGDILAIREDNNNTYSHSERLHTYIDEVLKESNVSPSDLSAIAVSKGPGSYTGLRIGVSTAKGLCFALDKPLISIPTLESLAYQVTTDKGIIIPMLDARRLEVYASIYDCEYKQIRETKAEILDLNSFLDYLRNNKVVFIGSGVSKTSELIKHPNAVFIQNKLPSARDMGQLAYVKYKKNDIEDVAYFEPYYLKDFLFHKSK